MPVPQTTPRPPLVTVAEYLRAEGGAAERSEFHDGVVRAMAGESTAHGRITFNLGGLIHARLDGKPCEGWTKDTKVRSGPAGPRPAWDTAGLFSYPDVVVTCDEPEYFDDGETVITNPTAIFEVLSPSTERFDRGGKFARYRRWNPTLAEYILVSQDEPRVERFTRQPTGRWELTEYEGLDAVVSIPTIGCELPLVAIYARVRFPSGESPTPDAPPG